MKRSLAIVLAAAMLLLLAACGSKKQPTTSPNTQSAPVTAEPADVTAAEPAAALQVITDDFTDTTAELTQKLDETFAAVGTTYADYQKNKGMIDEWVALVLSIRRSLCKNKGAFHHLLQADRRGREGLHTANFAVMLWSNITIPSATTP
ncbi:MAG: hypothetical protein V8S89_07145 [Oscillospiraceae bacterium]